MSWKEAEEEGEVEGDFGESNCTAGGRFISKLADEQ